MREVKQNTTKHQLRYHLPPFKYILVFDSIVDMYADISFIRSVLTTCIKFKIHFSWSIRVTRKILHFRQKVSFWL
jgi:hypothetical protein